MRNIFKNKEGGFLKYVITIVAALALMQYYHITANDVFDWFKSLSLSKIIDWLKALFYSVF